jgi:hypothetical protein
MITDLLSVPNIYFFVVMVGLVIMSVVKPFHVLSRSAPTYLTTIGIIGTFFGLYLALKDFNPLDINNSIPILLEGLKTKFLISLWGVLFSLLLKIYFVFVDNKNSSKSSDATLDDVVDKIESLKVELTNQVKTNNDNLVLLRSDFSNFTERMAKDNSAAFISALESVIKDFNTKINEQFGDNFKQLNMAVGRLLDWQENNKNEMQNIIQLMNKNTELLNSNSTYAEKINNSLSSGIKQLELFNSIGEYLKPTLEKMNADTERLQIAVKTFSEIANQAKELYPILKVSFQEMVDKTDKEIKTFVDGLDRSLRLQTNAIEKMNKDFVEIATNNRSLTEKAITDISRHSSAKVEQLAAEQKEIIKKQLTAIDKGLEEELTKALESLGNSLASLSEKFVSDYSGLADKLQELTKVTKQNISN